MSGADAQAQLAALQKQYEKLNEQLQDSLKEYAEVSKEAREASLKASITERSAASLRRERAEAVKAEQTLLADFKIATLEKVDQDKEYQNLRNKIADLNQSIAIWETKKKVFLDQHQADKAEIEEQRKTLHEESRAFTQKHEDDKRALVGQMERSKLELEVTFAEKLESLRKRYARQVAELKRDNTTTFNSENLTMTLKLENAQAENQEWHNKVEEAKYNLRQAKAATAKLEKDIRRQVLNDEVMGTSKIDELKLKSMTADEKRELAALQKKISALRQKIHVSAEEVLTVQHQAEAIADQIHEVKQEIGVQDSAYSQLEADKRELEERLTEQAEIKDRLLFAGSGGIQVEFDAEIEKLEEVLSALHEESIHLRERLNDLNLELKTGRKSTEALGAEMIELLTSERNKISKLDKEKRAVELAFHKYDKEQANLRERVQYFQSEASKQQKLYNGHIESTDLLHSQNSKLEQAVRRLETRL